MLNVQTSLSKTSESIKIYVASSWRNKYYQEVCKKLTDAGFEILDWRKNGFSFASVDPKWESWSFEEYEDAINRNDLTLDAFNHDLDLMKSAEACVLLLPCGNSAHIEAGWFTGKGVPVVAVIADFERADLMLKLCDKITSMKDDLADVIFNVMAERISNKIVEEARR